MYRRATQDSTGCVANYGEQVRMIRHPVESESRQAYLLLLTERFLAVLPDPQRENAMGSSHADTAGKLCITLR